MGSLGTDIAAEGLRISLRLGYARFDTFDLSGTETSGSALVLGTRDALGADGTLNVRDGCGCGQLSLAGLGRHDWCEGSMLEEVLEEGKVGRRMKAGIVE